jgi:hypothetical protein
MLEIYHRISSSCFAVALRSGTDRFRRGGVRSILIRTVIRASAEASQAAVEKNLHVESHLDNLTDIPRRTRL